MAPAGPVASGNPSESAIIAPVSVPDTPCTVKFPSTRILCPDPFPLVLDLATVTVAPENTSIFPTMYTSFSSSCVHVSPVACVPECDKLPEILKGAYAVLTGMVTLLAYWMAGTYETPYVLLVAMIVLFASMTLTMKFFGEEVTKKVV